jgi:SOS response regulatory protein OraA/RecX
VGLVYISLTSSITRRHTRLAGFLLETKEMSTIDYLLDELARYDIEVDPEQEKRMRRMVSRGYSVQELASAFNHKFRWNEEHGRLDVRD